MSFCLAILSSCDSGEDEEEETEISIDEEGNITATIKDQDGNVKASTSTKAETASLDFSEIKLDFSKTHCLSFSDLKWEEQAKELNKAC